MRMGRQPAEAFFHFFACDFYFQIFAFCSSRASLEPSFCSSSKGEGRVGLLVWQKTLLPRAGTTGRTPAGGAKAVAKVDERKSIFQGNSDAETRVQLHVSRDSVRWGG